MIAQIEVETDLLFANRLTNNSGWTWTLASRLGHILQQAQRLYGQRDKTYTILGVEIGEDIPRLWYPGNCRDVVVQISRACATNMSRACFQLAHEAIHLLAPSGGCETTVFDEGLAEHFSVWYAKEHLNADWKSEVESYLRACRLIERLLAIDANAVQTIRKHQPSLFCITSGEIRAVCPSVPDELADSLVERFQR